MDVNLAVLGKKKRTSGRRPLVEANHRVAANHNLWAVLELPQIASVVVNYRDGEAFVYTKATS